VSRTPIEAARGLTGEEVRAALTRDGPNRVHEDRRESLLETFLEEIREPMILLLLATGALYSVWGKLEDAITIFAVILVLVGVEAGNERRAERAIRSLSKLSEPTAVTLRDGRPVEVPTEEIVRLDVILLAPGRRIPADAHLLEAHSLAVDESILTGESVPVDKEASPERSPGEPDEDRRSEVFAGTTVTRGRGVALVVATGSTTELGRIARLAGEVRPPRTPLQLAMDGLSRSLVVVALSVSVLVPLLGFLVGDQPPRQMVLVGLSLAFATIPEELPIIITMVLGLGAYRLSKRRAIVKRLRAVETLGGVTFVATDKTGTLTENRMRVAATWPEDFAYRMLEVAALASAQPTADPTERALLSAALAEGIDIARLRASTRPRDEHSFDTARRLISVVCEREREGDVRVAVMGAPEEVLARAATRWTVRGERPIDPDASAAAEQAARDMAAEGLRVLAFAEKTLPPGPASQEEAESGLVFIGLAALADPPRPQARAAVETCRAAGIEVVMVSGDHPATAAAIARQVGLDEAGRMLTGADLDALTDEEIAGALDGVSVFARTTPEHKLRIVEAARARGHVVAVTGDGVNDAPALAAADVGVAMGETGTDVARESADIVLADDDFATIVHAVEEGRVLFANLRKGVRYYLACKVALIAAMLLPAVLGVPLPFAPVQIILMELFMDLAASATFVAEPGEPGIMRRPPRDPRRPFMDWEMTRSILVAGAGLFAAVAVAYLATWRADPSHARTVAFATWLLGHFFLAMNLRSERLPLLRLGVVANRLMAAWGGATVAFVLLAVLVPGVHDALRTTSLSAQQWVLAAGAAFAGTFWLEVRRWIGLSRS